MSDTEKTNQEPAPLHAIEIRIHIGANTPAFVARTLAGLYHDAENGELRQCASGGNFGCFSVTVAERDVTPEQYREELLQWSDRNRQ